MERSTLSLMSSIVTSVGTSVPSYPSPPARATTSMCFLIISVYLPGVLTVYHLVEAAVACLTENLADGDVVATELLHQVVGVLSLPGARGAQDKDHVVGCGKATSESGSGAVERGDGASGEHSECGKARKCVTVGSQELHSTGVHAKKAKEALSPCSKVIGEWQKRATS